jgi:integrase
MAKRPKGKASGSRGKRGAGSKYQEADGSWRVALWIEGRLIRRRAATSERSDEVLAELIKLRDSGTEALSGLQSVSQFAEYWYREVYMQREVKQRSVDHVRAMLELHILPILGKRALSSVTHAQLQKLLNDMRRRKPPLKPLSAQTVRHVYSVLKQLFGKAKATNLITLDPSEGLEVPKIKRAARPALTIEQIRQLLAVVDSSDAGARLTPAFHLMVTLGLRIGEALGVRCSDFSANFDTLTINQQISFHSVEQVAPKSEASARTLPVPPRLAARLRRHWELTYQGEPGLMFPTAAGKPTAPRNFEKLWSGYTHKRKRASGFVATFYPGFKQQAGLPDSTTLHDLRRFVATTLEDLEIGQRTIGHILGHEAGNVTEGYIKRNLPTLRRALEKLEQALWEQEDSNDG